MDSGEPFYRNGLRFSCQQCHHCCRGTQAGWVYVKPREIQRLAHWLKLPLDRFRDRYLTRDEDGETALELQPNGDCVFWKDGCTVYPARPRQCRTFPFWAETLASPEAWAEAKKTCHGMDQGRLYPLEEIRAVLHGRATGD